MTPSERATGRQPRSGMSPELVAGASGTGDRLLLGLIMALVVGVPTVFYRRSFLTFDIPQLTLLWVLTVAILLVGMFRLFESGVVTRGPVSLTIASGSFLAALVLTSAVSELPWVAFTGLTVRGAGAITYGLCLGLLHAVFRLGTRRSLYPVVMAIAAAHGLVVLYALLQAFGLDPFSWGTGELSVGPVFSTLGNPNFSAGYIGLTLPILVWVAFGSRRPVGLRMAVGAGIGASSVALAYLDSYQGDLAALSSIGVLGHWALLRSRSGRPVAAIFVLPAALTIGLTPLLFAEPGFLLLAGQMAVTAASVLIGTWFDQNGPNVDGTDPATRLVVIRWKRLVAAVAGICIAATLLSDRILDEINSGLTQRLEFWKVSASIFRSSPLVGTGLETYPTFFTSHRSKSHAVNWETVLSDSPHSVPLGILSGGGLVLAISYVSLVLTVGYFGGRAVLRAKSDPDRLFYGAVLASWIAYHVQSTVSIDMPGLIHIQWVLGGILLAGGTEPDRLRAVLVGKSGRNRSPRTQRRNAPARTLGSAALPLLAFVFLLGPITAPFRADLAGRRAQEAIGQTDYQSAGEELLRAIELQPRNGRYADGMALVYEESGLFEHAYEQRQHFARLSLGNPGAARSAAVAAIRLNRLEEAAAWFEMALLAEPYGPSVVVESAWFFNHIEKSERARELLFDFEVLGLSGSPGSTPWRTAEVLYRQLGEHVLAHRALTCYGGGGVLVPDDCGNLVFDSCPEQINGTLDCVIQVVNNARARRLADPNGSSEVAESAQYFSQIGDIERARELLSEFEALGLQGSPLSMPWRSVEVAYRELGETALADRAQACWGGGGVPVPDDCGNLVFDSCPEQINGTLDCVTQAVNNARVRFDGELDLREADLREADLTWADLREADLREADLREADLREADLREADLSRTSLEGANLSHANLSHANLREADLRRANLANASLAEADLSIANLEGADLEGANLEGANLVGVRFRQANLAGANLQDSYLGADLREANLSGADLSGANLSGADLSGADLSGANLERVYAAPHGVTADKYTTWPPGFDPATSLLAVHPRSD